MAGEGTPDTGHSMLDTRSYSGQFSWYSLPACDVIADIKYLTSSIPHGYPVFTLFLAKCLTVNRKWLPFIVIIVLGILLFFVKRCQQKEPAKPKVTTDKKKDPASTPDRNHGFDRRVSYIEYTQHARCRMQCRKISQAEVEEIMRDGKINYNKSNVDGRPCPTYALEGLTDDNQSVRIVFGQCDLKTKVITVIDLETDWTCDCPGDDNKYKNRN
jgi:hypothetical protein